jgi:hypothetical protein
MNVNLGECIMYRIGSDLSDSNFKRGETTIP